MDLKPTYRKQIVQLASLAFIYLWCYTVASKLMDVNSFKWALFNQPLPHELAVILLFLLPLAELFVVFLLFFGHTQLYGFYLSFILMFLFTGYIGLIITGSFSRIPCSCGGILEKMSWNTHFYFNLFWLMLSILAIVLIKKGGKQRTA